MPGKRRSAVTFLIALGILVVILGGFAALLVVLRPSPAVIASCSAGTYVMDPVQAENAAVIASVAQQRNLPPRAVTVAIAVAMQESRLRNLDHGDRDSLGLFQQRPSQGWGTPEQVQDPVYAAGRFYDHLVQIPDWQTGELTLVADAVQRSAFPFAYGKWSALAAELTSSLGSTAAAEVPCL